MVGFVNSPYTLLLLREIEGLEDAILRIQRATEQLIRQEQASLSTLLLSLVVKGVELFSVIPQVKKELSHHSDDEDKDTEEDVNTDDTTIKEEEEEEEDYDDDEEDDLFLQTTWGLGNSISNQGRDNEADGLSDSEEEVDQKRRMKDRQRKNNWDRDEDVREYDEDGDEDYIAAEGGSDDDDDYYATAAGADSKNKINTIKKGNRSPKSSNNQSTKQDEDYQEVPLIQRIAQLIAKQKEGKNQQTNAEKDNCDGLTCPLCKKKFTESRYMRGHLNFMHVRKFRSIKITEEEELTSLQEYLESLTTPPFDCPVCIPLEFAKVEGIKKHLDRFHLENEGRIKLNFPIKDKDQVNLDLDHPCEHCQKAFKNRKYLLQHMKQVHQRSRLHLKVKKDDQLFHTLKTWVLANLKGRGDGVDPRCPICGVECIQWHKRERHVVKYHFQQGEEFKKILSRHYPTEDPSKISSKKPLFPCIVCEKPCRSLHQAKIHADTHHHPLGILCPVEGCGNRFLGSREYMIHVKDHNEGHVRSKRKTDDDRQEGRVRSKRKNTDCHATKPSSQKLTCLYPNCGRRFSSATQLKIHLRSHTGERPYICSICGKGLITAYDLKRHEYALHNPDCRTYQCEQCPTVLKCSNSLKVHMKSVHNEEREKVLCPTCGKLFASKWILNSHVKRVHLQIRPHKCHLCPKAFKVKRHLAYHLKTHENPGGRQRGLNRPKE